jgi:hypothetical protein
MISIVIVIALLTGILFNAKGLYIWASRLDPGSGRNILLTIVEPVYEMTHFLLLDSPFLSMRETFHELTGMEKEAGWTYATNKTGERQNENQSDPPVVTGTTGYDPETERMNTLYSALHPLKVLFLGDSMIEGAITIAFSRKVFSNKAISYKFKSHHSSGLSKPDYYNWPKEAESLLTTEKYDCIVVLIGTNDAQTIFTDDGKPLMFNSKEWLAEYSSRLTSFLSYLNGNSIRVYWIGMPRMKPSVFDTSMSVINRISDSVCSQFKRVNFISTTIPLGDRKGNYTDYIEQGKQLRFFRASDGIHFLLPAGEILTTMILDKIKQDFRFE